MVPCYMEGQSLTAAAGMVSDLRPGDQDLAARCKHQAFSCMRMLVCCVETTVSYACDSYMVREPVEMICVSQSWSLSSRTARISKCSHARLCLSVSMPTLKHRMLRVMQTVCAHFCGPTRHRDGCRLHTTTYFFDPDLLTQPPHVNTKVMQSLAVTQQTTWGGGE